MIRKATDNDTKEIWEAHVRSIRELCAKDYKQNQIERWSAFQYSHKHWVETMNKDFVIVVEKDGRVEGFCHATLLEEDVGEIMGLYLSPNANGMGYGRQLLNEAIQYLMNKNVKKVFLKATKTAQGFYEQMGFIACGPILLNETRGTKIECLPMERVLR